MPKKLTQEEFIKRANLVHNNKYNYSHINYEGSGSSLTIECPAHGKFEKIAQKHLIGQGCQKCSEEAKKDTLEVFTLKANSIHNNFYDYSESIYIKSKEDVSIICPLHGKFIIKPFNHLQGQGCPECSLKTLSLEEFINKAKTIHNNKYDYSKSVYKNYTTKLIIICPSHGEFEQEPSNHLSGKGCKLCGIKKSSDFKRYSHQDFIKKAKETHHNKYIYNNTYVDSRQNLSITCLKHGTFLQTPSMHLYGNGCPKCSSNTSYPELEIVEYIKSLGVPEEEILTKFRPSWMEKKELDIYLPNYNLAIEYNGTAYHHSSKSTYVKSYYKNTYIPSDYHFNKWKLCHNNDVILLSIYDFYWKNNHKKDLLKSKINHYLQKDIKIYARKCIIEEIDIVESIKFHEINHLEGINILYKDTKSFGMYYKDQLVMCATVGKYYDQSNKIFKHKLQRISTLKGNTIIGGISKFNKYFTNTYKEYSYEILLSSGGSSLKTSNYKLLNPRYFWVHPSSLKYFHRNSTQKSKLEKTFQKPLLNTDTETTYMERLGYLKVYDNGKARIFL